MTISQLKEEASRFRLNPAGNRNELVDKIMSHFEQHGLVRDLIGEEQNEEAVPQIADDIRLEIQPEDDPVTESRLRQALTAVTLEMYAYQREMFQQQ